MKPLLFVLLAGLLLWVLFRPGADPTAERMPDGVVAQHNGAHATAGVARLDNELLAATPAAVAEASRPEIAVHFGTRLDYLAGAEDPFLAGHHFMERLLVAAMELPVGELLAEAEAGDGEAAYALFAILNSCELLAPQSVEEAVAREQHYVEKLVDDPNREESWWDQLSSASERMLEVCSRWDRRAIRAEAWAWLSRSADLGYFPGMLTYTSPDGGFLAGRLALWGRTDVIEAYRSRVPGLLRRMVETGRPEALVTIGYHHAAGTLVPEDLVLAAAWLEAAVEAASEPGYSSRMLEELRLGLSARERREAGELAGEICRRYADGC